MSAKSLSREVALVGNAPINPRVRTNAMMPGEYIPAWYPFSVRPVASEAALKKALQPPALREALP